MTKGTNKLKRIFKSPITWFISICILILGGLIIYGNVVDGLENRGTFGDMFGGANALFSGLAFAGIIIAIILQKQELKLQREELKQTRKELKGQKEQLMEQNKTFSLQRFESTFFNLLNIHQDIINSSEFGTKKGRDAFAKLYGELISWNINKAISTNGSKEKILGEINIEYSKFYNHRQRHLAHYFRHIYTMIKFINESSIENKKFYTNIIRAQLSNSELGLLFYNCLSAYGLKKFKPLVEKYSLFNNLPLETIPSSKNLTKKDQTTLYKKEAFT